MIDAENVVFDTAADVLRATYAGISVSGNFEELPAAFPTVTIVEKDNRVYQKMRTEKIENAAEVLYEVNIFTNRVGYKKLDARKILGTVDEVMESMGLTRTLCNPVENLQDSKIYRIVARYEGIVQPEVGVDETVFRIYTS